MTNKAYTPIRRGVVGAAVCNVLGACALTLGLAGLVGLQGCAAPADHAGQAIKTESDKTDADKRASTRLQLAQGYFERGQYSTALDEIKRAQAAKPDSIEAISLRALVYAAMGESGLAEESFRRALSLNPKDGDVASNYGWFLCQQGQYAQAYVQFDLALAQPNYRGIVRTWLARGVCQSRQGDLKQAEHSLSHAFELEPGNPTVQVNLAEVLYRQGQYERARFYARRVNEKPELVNAQSLWLALRIERRLGNTVSVDDLGQQMRQRYADAKETTLLKEGRFDE
ncbi:MAG: type IV pilus biogenesis/stability protein PilW [Burkholderiaceae bacterium]|nr:type IV pilus biogenesis/stability protein PilW [Burkholderiaceae bacterium]